MENFENFFLILFFAGLLFLVYNIFSFYYNFSKMKRKEKKLCNELEKLKNEFNELYFHEKNKCVNLTEWGKEIYNDFKKLNENDIFFSFGIINERIQELEEDIVKIHKLINDYSIGSIIVINKINVSLIEWDHDLKNLNNFFVAIPISSDKNVKKLYCYTLKKGINLNNEFEGIVFTEDKAVGQNMIFSPYTHKLRNMTEYEFYKKFINNRINSMAFKNSKEADEYYEYMCNKFKNITNE
jgi:hypothetical protein